ncbi:glutathione peroxidase [Rhodococcus sp. X156]|uniref:glutathione peroxidase n=1 Tax=Rhodococcus sp. X156 TaxID=2499145 RepID=UPI000FD9E00D|nr:glutathione peroxidase [Rhodococcus sp. X156]
MSALVDIPFATADGRQVSLADHAGEVVLVVNVASRCGLTPQYEALQGLHSSLQARGLTVLAFPANNFMGQEPGTDAEIADFCSTQYAVTFPVLAKISVVGDDQHPLYAELTRQAPAAAGTSDFRDNLRAAGIEPTEDPDVLWNFEKFLVSKQGEVVARFAPSVAPDAPEIVRAVEAELAR